MRISEHAESCPECGMKLKTLTASMMRMTKKMEAVRDEVRADPEGFKQRMRERNEQQRQTYNPTLTMGQGVKIAVTFIVLVLSCTYLWVKFVDEPRAAKARAEREAAQAEEARKNSPEERKIARFKASLDSWDGAPKKLKELIKKGMNDPDSFKHDRLEVHTEAGDFLLVTEHFLGKNMYGGTVRNWAKAKLDIDGNVLQVYKTSADE
jgi:hypothetical protein